MTAALTGLPVAEAIAWERALLLLGPLVLSALLVLATRPTPRQASAAMLAFLWQIPSLLALNLLARQAGWWTFPEPGISVLGLPVDIWVGWAFWWGPVPALLERRLGIPLVLALAAGFDAAAMPLLDAVALSPGWFVGEPVFVALGLLPGLMLARWTRTDRLPLARTLVHACGWGLYMLFALPAAALAVEGRDLLDALTWPAGPVGWTGAALFLVALLAGATAAFEFAIVGQGSPVPVDPPKRVVMTGPYAYVANPMQVTSTVVMALLAWHYASPGLLGVTAAFVVFETVFAAHYNKVHIARAMPGEWGSYKAAVADWRVRWVPYRPGVPLVVANTADEAEARVAGFLRLDPGVRLRRRRASGFSRLAFACPVTGVRARGVEALSRLLERRNLAWAMLAWTMRLPVVLPVLQAGVGAVVGLRRRAAGIRLAPHRARAARA